MKLNKKITDQDLKISEHKGKIQKEMGIYDDCKNAFDESIKKAVSYPNKTDFLRMRKEIEKLSTDTKRLNFELETAQKVSNDYKTIILHHESQIKELNDMNSSLKIDEKYEGRLTASLRNSASSYANNNKDTNEVDLYQKMFTRNIKIKEEKS